jgi:hypothetical protein
MHDPLSVFRAAAQLYTMWLVYIIHIRAGLHGPK